MTPFNQLLLIRSQIISFYKKNERIILPLLKFLVTVSVLLIMSNTIGYAKPLTRVTVMLVTGLIGVFLSPQLLMLLFIFITSAHAGAGSIEAGLIIFVILFMIYLLFIRLYPRESLFIIATIIAYKFHIPYIIPLIAGLFSSLAAIIALIIGITIWYSTPNILVLMESKNSELADMVGDINEKLTVLQSSIKNDQTLLVSIIILSLVLLAVYIIRKQNIDFAEYIAILIGVVLNLVGFLFAIILLRVDVGIIGLMLSTLICALIAIIVQFFAKVVDYSRTETVQFEDDNNYYYVKVVPKIIVKNSKKQVQRNYTQDDIIN